jgi:hypothetical protein
LIRVFAISFGGNGRLSTSNTYKNVENGVLRQITRQVGQLFLLRDDRYPAGKLLFGRIVHVHVSHDDLIQIVTVKTAITLSVDMSRPCSIHVQGICWIMFLSDTRFIEVQISFMFKLF